MTRRNSEQERLQTQSGLPELIADMDHRLRSPIQTILSLCDLLTDTNLDSEQEQYVMELQASADKMISLLSDLAEISDIREVSRPDDAETKTDHVLPDGTTDATEPASRSVEFFPAGEAGISIFEVGDSQQVADGKAEQNMDDLEFLNDVSVLDEDEAFERIGHDRELLAELIQIFCDEAEERLRELTTSSIDGSQIARIAHAMKGAAGNISANRLREIAIELEKASKKGDQTRTWRLIGAMRLETKVLRQELTRLGKTASQ